MRLCKVVWQSTTVSYQNTDDTFSTPISGRLLPVSPSVTMQAVFHSLPCCPPTLSRGQDFICPLTLALFKHFPSALESQCLFGSNQMSQFSSPQILSSAVTGRGSVRMYMPFIAKTYFGQSPILTQMGHTDTHMHKVPFQPSTTFHQKVHFLIANWQKALFSALSVHAADRGTMPLMMNRKAPLL